MTEKLIEALAKATEFIKEERESFHMCCVDGNGLLEDGDAKALSDMDDIINQAESAIKESSEGGQTVSVLQKGYVVVSVETIRKQINSEPTRTIRVVGR